MVLRYDAVRRALATGLASGLLYALLNAAFYSIPSTSGVFMLSPVQCAAPAWCLFFGGPAIIGCSVAEALLLGVMQGLDFNMWLRALLAITVFDALPYYMWYAILCRSNNPFPRFDTTGKLALFLGLSFLGLVFLDSMIGYFSIALQFESLWGIRAVDHSSIESWLDYYAQNIPAMTTIGLVPLIVLDRCKFKPFAPVWIKRSYEHHARLSITQRFITIAIFILLFIEIAGILSSVTVMMVGTNSAWALTALNPLFVSQTATMGAESLLLWLVAIAFLSFLEKRHTKPLETLSVTLRNLPNEIALQRNGSDKQAEDESDVGAQTMMHRLGHMQAGNIWVASPHRQKVFGEIADLIEGTDSMSLSIIRSLDTMQAIISQRERLNAELDAAGRLQKSVLPHEFSTFESGYDISLSALIEPARQVGGDFYDVFPLDAYRLCFLIADVSGKGLSAALFMMRAQMELREAIQDEADLGKAFEVANRALCDHNDASMFVTAFAAILDCDTGVVTYVAAGHNPPWIISGLTERIELPRSRVLGFLPATVYTMQTYQLKSAEGLFLYTDGVIEALNKDGVGFGNERLKAAISTSLRVKNFTAKDVVGAVKAAVANFAANAEQFDDITMLCFLWHGQ